jgi:hypothetical protein
MNLFSLIIPLGIVGLIIVFTQGKKALSKSSILTTFIGYIVLFILLSITMGGPSQVLSMLLILVICTGGVGLIGILGAAPVAYAIGVIILSIFNIHLQGKPQLKTEYLTHDEIAVISYIRQGRTNGASDLAISAQLQKVGWGNEIIKESFKKA